MKFTLSLEWGFQFRHFFLCRKVYEGKNFILFQMLDRSYRKSELMRKFRGKTKRCERKLINFSKSILFFVKKCRRVEKWSSCLEIFLFVWFLSPPAISFVFFLSSFNPSNISSLFFLSSAEWIIAFSDSTPVFSYLLNCTSSCSRFVNV
jgi:hypothetical protein